MMRRITALFFFLGVYVLGFAENTRGREYILVLSSINFNEAWANNLYQNILDEFSSPGFHVEAEELSIPMMTRIEEVEEKREYLLSRYLKPPKVVVFIGDPAVATSVNTNFPSPRKSLLTKFSKFLGIESRE